MFLFASNTSFTNVFWQPDHHCDLPVLPLLHVPVDGFVNLVHWLPEPAAVSVRLILLPLAAPQVRQSVPLDVLHVTRRLIVDQWSTFRTRYLNCQIEFLGLRNL